MEKLNNWEKKVILKAIKIIHNYEEVCSCDAIRTASRSKTYVTPQEGYALAKKYNNFYHKHDMFQWPGLPVNKYKPNERVMLLSMFLAANS